MSEPAPSIALPHATDPQGPGAELARFFGIGRGAADRLVDAGHVTVQAVRALSDGELAEIGLSAQEVDQVRSANAPGTDGGRPRIGPDGERIVSKFLESVKKGEKPRRRNVAASPKASAEVLKKWVEGDDAVLEAWIQQDEPPRPTPGGPTGLTPVAPQTVRPSAVPHRAEGPTLPTGLSEREETVVHWLTDLLDRVKSEQFDPSQLLQEVRDLHRQLYDERQRRKQLDEELEHVKRGSIAVIKYVRTREAKEREEMLKQKEAELADLKLKLFEAQSHPTPIDPNGLEAVATVGPEGGAPVAISENQLHDIESRVRGEFTEREHAFIERETELRRRIIQLEGDVRNFRSQAEATDRHERLAQLQPDAVDREVGERLRQADTRERELVLRENELRTKFEEIRIRAEEIERKREPIQYKEKELQNWEQELRVRQQALEVEGRRVEQARVTAGSPESAEAIRRLKDLQQEIVKKEEELRTRERFLHQKMEELEGLERKAAESEADRMHTDIVATASENKLKSGIRRLDDLMFGGIPAGAQVLLNGPAHTGKDVLARLFAAEGLRAGIPALWVVTDKAYSVIREEMTTLYPGYPEAERKGLVRYVDLYAKSLGVTQAEPGVVLLAATDKGVLEQLTQAVNEFCQEFKQKYASYRLIFESVSTLTAYLDTTQTFRFLQPFTGRRKLDRAAGYYLLETGMHSESDLQTLEHMVDGSVNLKIDQLKTYLSIRGITDVQSRAWVGYTFTKKSFNLGSFSLDHIR
jgi:KaiC/GvpD/RAD55 family RecA-like ATPase